MGTPSKQRGRRYSREAQQEDLSEAQLKERLAALGWPANRLGRDLGEDLLVQVYDQGESSGLSFYVQLKSVRDAERRRPKGAPLTISFPRTEEGREAYRAFQDAIERGRRVEVEAGAVPRVEVPAWNHRFFLVIHML